jgi:signal transduction histidine kinase
MSNALQVVHALMAAFGVALVAGLCIVLSVPSHHHEVHTRFEQAQLCIEAAAAFRFNRTGLHELLAGAPRAGAGCWQSISLPHLSRVDDVKLIRHDIEPLQRARYVFHYTVPGGWQAGESLMIYSPKLWGLGWQLRVDGQILRDNLDDWRMTFNRPVVARAAPGQFQAGDQIEVELAIAFEPARGHSLARVSIGPASALARAVVMRQYLQETLPFASTLMLLAMGVFFFCFWLARPREKAHLLLTLSCVAWCIFNLQFVLPSFDNVIISNWYRGITSLAIPWAMWLVYLFVLQIDRRFSQLFKVGMPLYVVAMSLLMLPPFRLSADIAIFYQGLNTLVCGLLAMRVVWLAITSGNLELRVISGALLLGIAIGAHDVAMLAQRIDAEGIFLLPYGSLAMFGAFLFAVQRRYVRAINAHEQLSGSLAQQLTAREAQLQEKQQRLLELERAQVLADERQRLMRDMHDGLGSTLTASLAMLEQGNTSPAELTQVLRESVDDLRVVIDSLEPVDGELVTLLATLRFRLGRRLELAGIHLEWDMQDVPQLEWLGPPQALQVMRIVQEALTNILKHSAATRVQMSAQPHGSWIEVRIADNGRGLCVPAALAESGRGLRNLRRRAEALQAQLHLDSQPAAGTTLRLLLPLVRIDREPASRAVPSAAA